MDTRDSRNWSEIFKNFDLVQWLNSGLVQSLNYFVGPGIHGIISSKPFAFLYNSFHINDLYHHFYAADYILISAVCWLTIADIDRMIVYILKQRLKSSTAVKSSPALCKQNIRLRRWGQYIDNAQKSCQQTCLFWLISCSRTVPNLKSFY